MGHKEGCFPARNSFYRDLKIVESILYSGYPGRRFERVRDSMVELNMTYFYIANSLCANCKSQLQSERSSLERNVNYWSEKACIDEERMPSDYPRK